MKLWLTTREIADMALPGLPARQESVIRLAERENWSRFPALVRPRQGRGGGTEYHVALLPPEARAACFALQMGEEIAAAAQSETGMVPDLSGAPGAGMALDARLAVIGAFRAFQRGVEINQSTAIVYFCDLWRLGRIDAPAHAREQVKHLSTRTMLRWLTAAKKDVRHLAVDRGAGRRGGGLFDKAADGRVKAYALALIAHNAQLTGRQIHDALRAKFGELRLPGLRALEIALKRWRVEHATELLALTNPDAFVSRTRVSGSYAHLVTRLNELWQIDASPVDALCVDGRHSVYVCIDVWSRRIIVHVARTPRAEAVQLLLRKAIHAWGAPEQVKTDNGSDFIARATRRLFAALNIEAINSAAFSPWQKGVVERAIRTFQTDCCRTLPGFIGHSVADRKVIEARRAFAARLGTDDAKAFAVELTGEQLQRDVDVWAETIYAHRPHGGVGGATPFARAASSAETIRRVDEQALAVLLMPAAGSNGLRTVGKEGVRVDRFHYLAPELIVGERVFVRLDPADMGRAYLFDEAGDNFRTVAICPELAGVERAGLVAEVKAAQKRLIEARTVEMKRDVAAIKPRTVFDDRARLHAEAAQTLIAFPKKSEPVETPAIDAAMQALRGKRAPEPAPLSTHDAALLAKIEAEMEAGTAIPRANVRRLRSVETPQQRFRRWLELKARHEAGEQLATDDAIWLGGYGQSAECRGMQVMHQRFGEQALR